MSDPVHFPPHDYDPGQIPLTSTEDKVNVLRGHSSLVHKVASAIEAEWNRNQRRIAAGEPVGDASIMEVSHEINLEGGLRITYTTTIRADVHVPQVNDGP